MVTISHDSSEFFALAIVGAAFFFYLRSFFVKKSGSCCGKACKLRVPFLSKNR